MGLGLGLVGIIGLAVGFASDHAQFYKSYLLAYIFVLGIPIGSLALLMIHHLSGGRWSLVLRRTFEASARTIPLMAVLFLPIVLGIHDLYEWSHADVVANDAIIRHKAPYLNQTGFIAPRGRLLRHLVGDGADAVALVGAAGHAGASRWTGSTRSAARAC